MPQFSYEAVNKKCVIQRGEVNLDSRADVVATLRETGFYAIKVKEIKREDMFRLKQKKKVKISDLAQLSRQFATLINSGVTAVNALTVLGKQSSNNELSKTLDEIAAKVESGMSISDAFSKYPDIFDDLYVSMIHAGEVGGMLEETLDRLATHLEKEKKLKDNIKTAINYPKVVGIFAIVMFLTMMIFLVPTFKKFTSQNASIPGITKVIYALSDSMRGYWYLWILGITSVVLLIMIFTRSRLGHEIWERFKLKAPLFGSLIRKTVISRFVRTLSTLIRGGIPIVYALESSGPTSGSLLVSRAVEAAAREIEVGRSISKQLAASGIFPPMVTEMIAIGEESGNLPDLLDKISDFYDQEIDTESKNLGTVLEPLMLILVGFVVGGMLIALYIPIFTSVVSAV